MLDKGVEDVEFLYPFYRFEEEGFEVVVVASKARETYLGKHGVPMQSDLSPDDVKIDEYEGPIIPGGRAPDYMRTDRQSVNIVKEAYVKGKVVAAICHGPQMLIEADVLRAKKATCWKSVITDIKNAGANLIDEAAVVDGNMVTSRSPARAQYDVVGMIQMPDNTDAAALSMALMAGGAVKNVYTTPLITFEQGIEAMKKARTTAYSPPKENPMLRHE